MDQDDAAIDHVHFRNRPVKVIAWPSYVGCGAHGTIVIGDFYEGADAKSITRGACCAANQDCRSFLAVARKEMTEQPRIIRF